MLHDDSLVQIEHLLLVRIAVGQGQFDVIKGENVEKCFKVFFVRQGTIGSGFALLNWAIFIVYIETCFLRHKFLRKRPNLMNILQ